MKPVFQTIILGAVYLTLFVACSPNRSGSQLNFPNNTLLPPSSATPGGSAPAASPNPSLAPAPSTNCPLGTEIATTSGGCITIKSQFSTNLSSNQTFKGLAADSSSLYMLVYQNSGNGIFNWLIEKTTLLTGSGWSIVCNILDDGNFSGGIGWDGTYFYISSLGGYDPELRRFRASDCTESSPISIQYPVMYTQDGIFLASDGVSQILIPAVEINGDFNFGAEFNSSNGALTTTFQNVSLGTQSTSWYEPSGLAVSGANIWAVFMNGSSNSYLWKLGPDGTPVGWADLTSSGNSSLYEINSLAVQSDTSAIVMTNFNSPTVLQFSVLDLSGF